MASARITPDTQTWIRFLARFAPIVSLVALSLVVMFFSAVGFADSDNVLGLLYAELLQAGRVPSAYQLAMIFDAFGWLTIGVSLIAFSRIFREAAPIRSTFIFVAGMGHLLGFLGGTLRMTAIHDIAVQYAATSDPTIRMGLSNAYLAVSSVIGGLFLAGDVLATIGWLLVGAAAWTSRILPRWVAAWTLSSGILIAVFTPLSAANASFAFPILLVYILSGVIAFHLVFAVKFWRAAPSTGPTF